MKSTSCIPLILCSLSVGITGCVESPQQGPKQTLLLATTTSTRDSGLMDVLIPAFEREYPVKIKLIAVGTGKALQLGRAGEVDLLLVHSQEDEHQFMVEEHGVRHEPLMYNYFEILGPHSDPAGINGKTPLEALRLIQESRAAFVSRGDKSGTHQREIRLWNKLGTQPTWNRYIETGQGMGPSLLIANQKQAYLLCDRGTFLSMKHRIELVPMVNKSSQLKNPYSLLCVNPNKNGQINSDTASRFVDFLISRKGQSLIADFKVDAKTLFHTLRTENNSPHR